LAKRALSKSWKRTQEQTETGHESEHRQDDLSTKEQSSTYWPAHVPEWKHAEKLACDLYEREKQREREIKNSEQLDNNYSIGFLFPFRIEQRSRN
jgi:hypothetical protein